MLTARAVCLAVLCAGVSAVDLVFPVPGGKVLGVCVAARARLD